MFEPDMTHESLAAVVTCTRPPLQLWSPAQGLHCIKTTRPINILSSSTNWAQWVTKAGSMKVERDMLRAKMRG